MYRRFSRHTEKNVRFCKLTSQSRHVLDTMSECRRSAGCAEQRRQKVYGGSFSVNKEYFFGEGYMNLKAEELSQIGAYQEGMNWNAVEQVIVSRRSVRSFK